MATAFSSSIQNVDSQDLVAVAAGSHEQVREWCRILKAAKLAFTVIEPCQSDSADVDYLEVWVARDDSEASRAALKRKDDKTRLW